MHEHFLFHSVILKKISFRVWRYFTQWYVISIKLFIVWNRCLFLGNLLQVTIGWLIDFVFGIIFFSINYLQKISTKYWNHNLLQSYFMWILIQLMSTRKWYQTAKIMYIYSDILLIFEFLHSGIFWVGYRVTSDQYGKYTIVWTVCL